MQPLLEGNDFVIWYEALASILFTTDREILDHVEILEAQFEHLNIEMGVGANLLGVIDDL